MKFHVGPIPQSPDFDTDGWNLLREPKQSTLVLLAILVVVISSGIVGSFWSYRLGIPRQEILYPYSPLVLAGFSLVVIGVHELLHVVVFPDFKRSVVGLWPGGFAFFAHYDGALTRSRLLLCGSMPLIILTLLPIGIALIAGHQSKLGAAVSTWNAMFACVDIIMIQLVARNVPAGAVVRNQGWKTYWTTNK